MTNPTSILTSLAAATPDGARLLRVVAAFLQSATTTALYVRRCMWEQLASGAPEARLSTPDAEAAIILLAAAIEAGDAGAVADVAALHRYLSPIPSFKDHDGDAERASIRSASLATSDIEWRLSQRGYGRR